MTITTLPTPAPSRTMSQTEFDAAVAAHIAALPQFVTETNALEANVVAKEASAVMAADDAADSASIATTAAASASGDAAAAHTERVAAQLAQAAAEAALDAFDDRWLGAKASDPSVDNDGNPLIEGAQYFNTTIKRVKYYTGSQWNVSYADSVDVTHTPAGTAAVTTTVQAKLRERVSVRDFGATGDGTTDDTGAIQAALNSGAKRVLFPSGTYVVTSLSVGVSGQELVGEGRPTLLAKAGSAGSPILLNVNAKDDVAVSGIAFDGNTGSVTSFNNVVQTFNANRVRFAGCFFKNCRGIALLASGGTYISVDRCEFDSCGLYHLTSGSSADRRQAVAFSNVSHPAADFNVFRNIGLDCISFATGVNDARAVGNKVYTSYAGSIYVSNVTRGVISGNIVNNGSGGGNGIDIANSTHLSVANNVCFGNGAAGILVANASSEITLTGNVCYNNWQSKTSAHRGGITLSAGAGETLSDITLAGNVCYDNQGAGAVTQRYAIGVYDTGGAYNKISIDQSNRLTGYSSGGAFDITSTFQSTILGMVGYPYALNLADQAEVTLYTASGALGEFSVTQTNNGYYGLFASRLSNSPLKLLDPGAQYDVVDTGTLQVVYRDSATNTVRLKNRTGATRTYIIVPRNWAYLA